MTAINKLIKLSDSVEETNFKIIAKKIIENFAKGEFKNQEELAKECYVSLSTITKFSQKIGCTGYRELVFILKSEYDRYGWTENVNKVSSFERFESIQKWIIENSLFIENLAKAIKDVKIINLYPSNQIRHASLYISELFANLNKVVRIISWEYRKDAVKNSENELEILIVCSSNNRSLLKIFECETNEENKRFLITTANQDIQLDINFTDKTLINYQLDKTKSIYRNIALEMLFLQIFECVQNTF
ncbi:MurR/RpiR family transcriptional regulator [Spiroplasma cantharicola]|uniref:HTH rpiR-type domain-containing protein n=1 Tax=Spiroplasma cantharicola TaxID=362837 RepID=A0A0M4JJR2_9MOLU|nr:hypothetical protein [Spiroplasma cantharicola]ALD66473.1 hypothetical protein SCANT_v1c05670 [Spiroplasma cantharicola]